MVIWIKFEELWSYIKCFKQSYVYEYILGWKDRLGNDIPNAGPLVILLDGRLYYRHLLSREASPDDIGYAPPWPAGRVRSEAVPRHRLRENDVSLGVRTEFFWIVWARRVPSVNIKRISLQHRAQTKHFNVIIDSHIFWTQHPSKLDHDLAISSWQLTNSSIKTDETLSRLQRILMSISSNESAALSKNFIIIYLKKKFILNIRAVFYTILQHCNHWYLSKLLNKIIKFFIIKFDYLY